MNEPPRIIQIQTLAESLIEQYLSGENWHYSINSKKRILGQCSYSQRTISLSVYHIATGELPDIENTIRHEIAHALTPGAGHNKLWRMVAKSVGARPERCSAIGTGAIGRYIAHCPKCNQQYKLFRKPRITTHQFHYCKTCGANEGRLTYFENTDIGG